mmetsp:Transcript_7923/g.23586  ORF Transcript_7923/g.23586 Transcript_7923/m.23586 type:complete len:233 (-) Transcript_7923:219-917(-)
MELRGFRQKVAADIVGGVSTQGHGVEEIEVGAGRDPETNESPRNFSRVDVLLSSSVEAPESASSVQFCFVVLEYFAHNLFSSSEARVVHQYSIEKPWIALDQQGEARIESVLIAARRQQPPYHRIKILQACCISHEVDEVLGQSRRGGPGARCARHQRLTSLVRRESFDQIHHGAALDADVVAMSSSTGRFEASKYCCPPPGGHSQPLERRASGVRRRGVVLRCIRAERQAG